MRRSLIWIDAVLDDAGLSPYAFRAYGRIARRAGKDGVCYETAAHMAEGCDMSERQLYRAITELVGAGLIEKRPRKGASTLYALKDLPVESEGMTDRQRGSASQADEVHPSKNNTLSESVGLGSDDDETDPVLPPERTPAAARQAKGIAAPPKRRTPSPWQQFVGAALEAWNEYRHSSWVEMKRPTGRGGKYLKEFFAFYDKDPQIAGQAIAEAVKWAKGSETWWQDRPRMTFDEMAANNKLESYAEKALAREAGAVKAASEGGPGGPVPGQDLEGRVVALRGGWRAVLGPKYLNSYTVKRWLAEGETPNVERIYEGDIEGVEGIEQDG